ncbi:hypothetical protein AB0B57_03665 [Micromonospora sp. NPDC049101]|uniref:hypothetical protein n=1 Tax=Micromonospora sp. NPDC049101 TaxID=3155032 RepID=UPI0033CA5E9E
MLAFRQRDDEPHPSRRVPETGDRGDDQRGSPLSAMPHSVLAAGTRAPDSRHRDGLVKGDDQTATAGNPPAKFGGVRYSCGSRTGP